MDRTPSGREATLARNVRLLLRDVRVGDEIAIPERFHRDLPHLHETTSGLEYFIPEVIREIEPCGTLDGVFPYEARKVAPLELEIVGACVYIQGEFAPLYLKLRVAPDQDAFEWFHCRLGELGRGQDARRGREKIYDYQTSPHALGLKTLHRLDQIRWKHCVEYGERGPATESAE